MKKLKLLGLSALVVVGLVGGALAAPPAGRVVPKDQSGVAAHPWYGGYLSSRTTSTDEMLVCSGRCLLAGLIMNTGPDTTFIMVRNTSVENGTGALVFDHRFRAINTEPGNNPVRLPILLDKGITVDMSAASTAESLTVLYLDLD